MRSNQAKSDVLTKVFRVLSILSGSDSSLSSSREKEHQTVQAASAWHSCVARQTVAEPVLSHIYSSRQSYTPL